LVVFLAGFAQALAVTLDWATSQQLEDAGDGRTRISTQWASFDQASLEAVDGIDAVLGAALVDLGDGPVRVTAGTCDDLERYATSTNGQCEPDTIYINPQASIDQAFVERLGPVDSGLEVIIDPRPGGSGSTGSSTLFPPELLPTNAIIEYDIALSPGADPEAIGAALVQMSPGVELFGIDSPERGRLVGTYASLITAATLIAILLSLAATLAAVADRSLERRRHAAHLTALGLPPATLRNAETLTLVAPLAIGIIAAGLATVFSALAYFQLGESPIDLPVSSIAIIFGIGAIGAALTAATAYATTSVTHPTTALRTE